LSRETEEFCVSGEKIRGEPHSAIWRLAGPVNPQPLSKFLQRTNEHAQNGVPGAGFIVAKRSSEKKKKRRNNEKEKKEKEKGRRGKERGKKKLKDMKYFMEPCEWTWWRSCAGR